MDLLQGALDHGLRMLRAPFAPDERIFWGYLLTASFIALAALRDRALERGEPFTARGFLGQLFARDVWLHPSAKLDYAYFFVDAFLFGLLVMPWLGGSAAGYALGKDLASATIAERCVSAPPWALALGLTVALVLAMDLALFLVHWAQHRVPLLWEFHKVHHSAEVLTPITVYRMHPLDSALNMTVSGLFAGVVLGLGAWALPQGVRTITVGGLDLLTFLFYVVGYNLRHSHVWVDWGPALSHVLVSPAQHQIHHSVDPRHWDKNMGFMLAWWDWLAGTLYVPRGREELRFGLGADAPETKEHRTVWGVYMSPLRNLLAAARRTSRAQLACVTVALAALALIQLRETLWPRPAKRVVLLEQLTWPEVKAALDAGTRTVLIPTGGVEQNGPHMTLGKHGAVVEHTARRIAERLGDALVAPVIAYVPEGDLDPPTGHMAYPGTLSVPPAVFASVLEHAARSLKRHGFTTICFLGDSLWNQEPQAEVAAKLSAEWAAEGVKVIHLSDYYEENGQADLLVREGETAAAIGQHAGIRDTSEVMAVAPDAIRAELLAPDGGGAGSGVNGDPTRASAARGWRLLELKVQAGVRQVLRERAAR
jgi:sterol desaturase/sphingolipid hydroxylase (fatty acid hydroxylase superfamily)/creatinine amidohydrolase/Fe(II)-dependent formamide hydrolase-like protein